MVQRIFVLAESVTAHGGSPTTTRLLCEALAGFGHEVRLFVTHAPGASQTARLAARGIAVFASPFRCGSRWGLPRLGTALRLYLSGLRSRPHRIVSIGLTREADHLLGFPPIAPIHLWETTEALPDVKFVDLRITRRLRRATGLLAPSATIARNAKATYAYAGAIQLLPFWVEEPPARQYHPVFGRFVYSGRLDLDKGFHWLFEAFREVRSHHPEVTLDLCGGGDLNGVTTLAAGDPSIRIRGYVEGPVLEEAMQSAWALVLPSLHEGYPLSLLEACGRGIPIVATTVGSIPEVYGGRPCALLVPPRNADALAGAMRVLLADHPATRRRRIHDAHSLFAERSSAEVVRSRLREVCLYKG